MCTRASHFFPDKGQFCSKTSPLVLFVWSYSFRGLDVGYMNGNSPTDRLSIRNLRNSLALQPERRQSQAGGVSSGFLSLDGSMEPSKTCLTLETQPTGGQAATALPDTGPAVFSFNSLCLRETPGSSRQQRKRRCGIYSQLLHSPARFGLNSFIVKSFVC